MDLTIIIVNHNSYNLLINCLKSVQNSLTKSKLVYEVIVIDNASSNEDKEKMRRLIGVKFIYNDENVGFGRACNQGIIKAKSKFILLLNPDILVLDKAIINLYNFIEEKNKSFAGARLLNYDKSIQPSCGLFFSLPIVFLMLFLKGEQLHLTKFSPNKTKKVDWVSGACLIGRKNDFFKVGNFDEKIFLYTEEVDFLYRAKQQGFSCFFCSDSKFIHIGAAISGKDKAIIHIFRGLLYFYKKHYSYSENIALKLLLDLKAIIGMCVGLITFNKTLIKQYKIAYKTIN